MKRVSLEELVGARVFRLVPRYDIKAPSITYGDGDAQMVVFILDDVVYFGIEDPNDGYRSSLDYVLATSNQAVIRKLNPTLTEEVVCYIEDSESKYRLMIRSKKTQKLIFTLGTCNNDDYYPWFDNQWFPENLSENN